MSIQRICPFDIDSGCFNPHIPRHSFYRNMYLEIGSVMTISSGYVESLHTVAIL